MCLAEGETVEVCLGKGGLRTSRARIQNKTPHRRRRPGGVNVIRPAKTYLPFTVTFTELLGLERLPALSKATT